MKTEWIKYRAFHDGHTVYLHGPRIGLKDDGGSVIEVDRDRPMVIHKLDHLRAVFGVPLVGGKSTLCELNEARCLLAVGLTFEAPKWLKEFVRE